MKRDMSVIGRTLGPIVTLLALPAVLSAQLISLKTVPVAAGDQFLIFPSRDLGMGGVAIALDDPWLDPFVNPAKGGRISEAQVFASPAYYSISERSGSARTLPVGALFSSAKWFGGGMVALQELKGGEQFFGPVPLRDLAILPPNTLSERSATNKYVFLALGRKLPGDVAVAGSVFLGDLSAMDGVEHLYALAADIDQSGHLADLRLGVTKELGGGRTVEALVLHNRFRMTHDVTYVDWVLVDTTSWVWERQMRVETNYDRTNTWGLHLGYAQPIGTSGWRVGGILTGNRKSHPKIPNYEIMNIPRDPGHSLAYDIGVGISKIAGATTFGIDLVYEPATSETWAEAAAPVTTASGGVIPAGGKTVENAFRFSNAFVNLGIAEEVGPAAFQLGLQIRAYDYHLDQWDNVAETFRRQDEQWMEWTPSWGARVHLTSLELRYVGRVTTGTGRPGVAWTGAAREGVLNAALANDVIVAPGGPLTLQDAQVVTHQISVSLPIR